MLYVSTMNGEKNARYGLRPKWRLLDDRMLSADGSGSAPLMSHRAPDVGLAGPFINPIIDDIFNPDLDDKEPKASVLGNTRLTSLLGLIIFIELFVIGLTVPAIGQLFTLHAIVGYLLVVPILLKLTSTGYRFFSYYFKNKRYAAAGPPRIALRIVAPLLVISTVVVMVSGIVLMVIGPYSASEPLWKTIHQVSFVLWFVIMALHVVSYISKAVYQGGAEFGLRSFGPIRFSNKQPPHKILRFAVVGATMLFSVIFLIIEYHYIAPWTAYFSG